MTTRSYRPEQIINKLREAETEGQSNGFSHSVSRVPFHECHPYEEITSVEDHSIQGIIGKFISWIVNQNPRHAQLKIGTHPPIPIITPGVKDVRVRKKDVQKFKEYIYSRYARRAEEVDQEIKERKKQLLKESPQEPTNFRE